MAVYRYQVTCASMWRGKIKRWNTTFHTSASYSNATFRDLVSAASWKNPGDVTGACSGGVAMVTQYNAAGGAPLSQSIYFDWQTPTTWIPYTSTAWSGVDPDTPIDASGESALVVVGHMGGLSATGKPVTTRKYLHAVPSRTAADYADPDIDPTSQAAIKALFLTQYMCNPRGSAPGSVTVEPYYGNHQRVRGRRRTVSQVAAQSFSSGVVVGAAPSTSGGEPFRSAQ